MNQLMKEVLRKFCDVQVLVVGDLMLDTYLQGRADRISPEAPVPILHVEEKRSVPGGAANVAANVIGLGAKVTIAGVVGSGDEGEELISLLSGQGISDKGIVRSTSRPTTVKTRLLARHHQFARFDREMTEPLSSQEDADLWGSLKDILKEFDVIVISDYAKGVVTKEICARLITQASDAGKPLVVDPKGNNYRKYSGASVLTPNEKETFEAARFLGSDADSIEEAGGFLRSELGIPSLLVTRGERGMTLFRESSKFVTLSAFERNVFDVTGAGDTVIATVAVALAAGADLEEAAGLANLAAGCVVERLGTSAVTVDDLLSGHSVD